jgi:branched-chain amino acid aminotransferase
MATGTPQLVWLNGQYVPWAEATIHVSCDAVLFGSSVFEGLRGYVSPEEGQVYAFRLAEHLDRLWDSMKILRMRIPWSREELFAACTGIVARNGYREDVQMRPTVYFGEGPMGATDPDKIFTGAFITAGPKATTLEQGAGIACCVSAWRRLSDNVLPPRVKAGANYLQSRLVYVQAALDGYRNALILNDRDKVAEGPGSCFMLVKGGRVITPPVTAGILESITRDTIARFCRDDLGVPFEERELDRTEVYLADEAFFCGSAWEICPVASVDRYPIGDGAVGPITARLRALYHEVVRGRVPRYRHWLTPVY